MVAHAELQYESLKYQAKNDKAALTGQLVWDDRFSGPRPGILLVHEWWGLNDYIRIRAEQMARQGYAVMAIDMYGDGKLADHPKKAGELSGVVRQNGPLAEARFRAAMAELSRQDIVADEPLSAAGYCFGGSIVLDMALRGVDLKSVYSFHGGLAGLQAVSKKKPVLAKMMVFHGQDDSFISDEAVATFRQQAQDNDLSLEFVSYAGARHSFTNPQADVVAEKFELPNLAYHRYADLDSWVRMMQSLTSLYEEK